MKNNIGNTASKILLSTALAGMLVACNIEAPTYESTTDQKQLELEGKGKGGKIGDSTLFSKRNKDKAKRDNTNLANLSGNVQVNRYLWVASLDIISFLPLTQADAVAGVILTDWHSLPAASNKRYKLNLIITGTELRPDALNVKLFKQERTGSNWRDVPVDFETVTQFEESILTRAREIRFTSLGLN